ncbi:ChpI protein [Kouleothrix aurantiaca]|uniref:ChpI protein n=1 Tax=Kouleothrix aurantiaca TaxID=186479 RepID=A0A0P9CZP3_9CHLR|nr:ChpI protein [Kouleothrix aurantiaca]
MKTAISIPDPLFQAAEQFAHDNGLSRSELFARAVQLYLQTFKYQGITEALDQVYSDETSTLDPALAAAQTRVLSKEDW